MSTESEKPTHGDNTNEQSAHAAPSSETSERGDAASSAAHATATAESTTPATDESPATHTDAAPAQQTDAAPASTGAAPAPASAAPTSTDAAQAPTATAQSATDATETTNESAREADEEEPRGGGTGDFDFGAMLDQYEQEQAAFQEGSVVRGTVVGVNDRAVVIDFGFKSEGAVPIEERSEEHTSELQSRPHLVCRLLLEKKNKKH